MTRLWMMAAIALAALSAAPALGETVPDAGSGVACQVNGYAVIILNKGEMPIAAGTEVHWSVPFVRMEGRHALDEPLEPGAAVFVSAALGSNFLGTATPCAASIG